MAYTMSPAIQYVGTMLERLDDIEGNLHPIVQIAEQAADRLVAGGKLYAAADEKGFISEACGRAGGMMMIRSAPDASQIGDRDVVLMGTLDLNPDEQRVQIRAMRKAGAVVILFGSDASPLSNEADELVPSFLPAGAAPLIQVKDQAEKICPAGTVGNITALWVLTAELVAACTRRGKMPTMYQSVYLSTSRDRNARYQPYAFHEDLKVPPVPPGQAGRAYLTEIRRCFRGLRDHQIPFFEEGGWIVAEVITSGHKAWGLVLGHHLPHQFGLPGDPGLLDPSLQGKTADQMLATIGKGDALVYVGYYDCPEVNWQPVRDAGYTSVWITGARESKRVVPRSGEIHIDPYWTYRDACVEIPSYDVNILPPSGVIQTAALWMIIGEIAKALSKRVF